MRLGEPTWWYREKATLAARLLQPAALVWAAVAARRSQRTSPYRSILPVICIGNFTAGGTGKTPLTRRVVAMLRDQGRAPVVLSRGHGGRLAGPHWLDPTRDRAADVGDEPLLHAAASPVVVARDRAAGARLIEATATPDHVIVMDDGLQNPTLARTLSIAVVDGRRGLGNGRTMPAGPLRAPLDAQLATVDAIVVNVPPGASTQRAGGRAGTVSADLVETLKRRFDGPVLVATTSPVEPTGWLREMPVLAWAGIANPGRFFDLVELLGANVLERAAFADHETPSDRAAERLLERADRLGARLVTTEKDLARVAGGGPALAALAAASRALPIELQMSERETDRLSALLAGAMFRARLDEGNARCAGRPGPSPSPPSA